MDSTLDSLLLIQHSLKTVTYKQSNEDLVGAIKQYLSYIRRVIIAIYEKISQTNISNEKLAFIYSVADEIVALANDIENKNITGFTVILPYELYDKLTELQQKMDLFVATCLPYYDRNFLGSLKDRYSAITSSLQDILKAGRANKQAQLPEPSPLPKIEPVTGYTRGSPVSISDFPVIPTFRDKHKKIAKVLNFIQKYGAYIFLIFAVIMLLVVML